MRREASGHAPLVIVGDVLLDVDVDGHAERLCPDAPVPVIDVLARRSRPGGAGLAALLAAQEGTQVTLVAGIGDDEAGRTLTGMLDEQVELVPLAFRGTTACKTRVRAAGQSLVRMDSGEGAVLDEPLGEHARAVLQNAGAVLVADYGRGTTHNASLRHALGDLPPSVPLVWDPHPRGAEPVARADLVVPNRSEAAGFDALAQQPSAPPGTAEALLKRWGCGAVAVTLGAEGAVLASGVGTETFAASPVDPNVDVDTCGAGDSFAATAALAMSRGASCAEAVAAAVEEAGRFVARGGAGRLAAAIPDRQQPMPYSGRTDAFDVAARVRRRRGRLVATGGCFDLLHPGHVRLLERARALGDALVVCLNSDVSVRHLKGPGRPVVCEQDRRRLLLALEPVDAVAVFDESSPAALLDELRPDVWVKGGDYGGVAIPESEVVRRYGGCTEIVPIEDGYSTSRLLTSLRAVG
ncbi:rfaE bifunctional protein kinase chain/domain/rfaE bifunctional protein nucleotidyltransferase chain/domain [Halopolyspora algeriensis]|uniref:RfaE bifunctional protein kinase chain/domain/rfaE bifunctional protein nucleotidyltransferase chain/domain n=1 Tax=Halopolyspora algeriensis TaxID=1500506 RepID=A0A368VSD7_9ACTN|nr:PfkB family carbohydrate kinase [Halopolyspora algeriensis]RCW44619.1 rfaE bifunctional protein kinase chain/domain/rfaE bifunctional protein nucleotidyltransferase chain/domain [Halopolyspora algeriensis]TQM55980.1 rfaE bifunctional protein kinase chain/domain/rfaE bifunctional protein nucleotidyltransferase chain/domain [Halopolyspora algeriensis]